MAVEGLKIVIGADVNQAIQGINKFTSSFSDIEKRLAELSDETGDFAKALDQLGKEGALSISFIGKELKDFKQAFANATDPADVQKFGAALQILEEKQNQLIQSGLSAGGAIGEIEKHSGVGVVATQRLSASVLGLSTHLGALPPELAGLTHGFDQLIQGFERVTHGTEGTSEKILKFAGVLGEVGIGIAISVAIGLLIDLGKELFNTDAALEKATEEGALFAEQVKKINKSIEDSKANFDFLQKLADISIDINFDDKFQQTALKTKERLGDLGIEAFKLGKTLEDAKSKASDFFHEFQDGISDAGREIINGRLLDLLPDQDIKKLNDADQALVKNALAASTQVDKINNDLTENERQTLILRAELRKNAWDKEKEDNKKSNDELQRLLESRAQIIKEFTAKFASIKDPFPDFFSKNLPLGKVEDKALRAALENAFKVLETASKDLFNTKKIDPGTLPLEMHFALLPLNRTDLVRQIEDKFGEISKNVEDTVNKGIFEVPIDFKLAPEGNGKALKEAEDRLNELAKEIEGLTGQKKAILNFGFDISKLDPATFEKVVKDAQDEAARFAQGTPLIISIDADFKIKAKVDLKALAKQLNSDFVEILKTTISDAAVSLGNSIGDILSNTGTLEDGFKSIFLVISKGLASLGAALIKTGIIALGIKAALDKLAISPALTIALGVAMIALSKALQNSFSARETGGPVNRAMTYLVNERGPEMFIPQVGHPRMIEGGKQLFSPEMSGKILPAWMAKNVALKMNIPTFEQGGAITGPTFSLLGEGFGISASNPEFVIPSSAMKSLLTINDKVNDTPELFLRGNDFYLMQKRMGRKNLRLT